MYVGDFKFPDECPEDCAYRGSFRARGQSALCGRCPIFNCVPDGDGFCPLEVDDYRLDWAAEWDQFFRTGQEPRLWLLKASDCKVK